MDLTPAVSAGWVPGPRDRVGSPPVVPR